MKKLSVLLCIFLFIGTKSFSNNYYVTSRTDSLSGSLRAAIDSANVHAGPDSIIILLGIYDTIHLASSLPPITDTLVVTGQPRQNPTISGDSINYYAGFNSSAPLTLNYINIFK